MPETLERDPLADAFFQFRIDAPHEISVPGAGAAKLTMKRRQHTRFVATIVVVLAGLTGAGLALGWPGQESQPAAAVSSQPPLNSGQLDQLGVQALAKLGYPPQAARPGILFGGMTSAASGFSYSFGSAADPFPPGTYTVTAVCVGAGHIEVTWIDAGQIRHLPVSCGQDPASSIIELATPGTVGLRVTPDAAAAGQAGAAVMVTDPRTVAAQNALGTFARQGMEGLGFAERDPRTGNAVNRMDVDQTGTRPGDYTLTVACAGVGTIKATLSIGDATATKTVSCQNMQGPPSPVSLTLHAAGKGTVLTVVLEPDQQAAGSAGYAYAFTATPAG